MPFVETRGATLFVTLTGPANAPPVFFLNSLGTTHRMWDAIAAELSVDHRCIRCDTRGHGASTRAKTPFEIADLADDAVALLDHFGVARAHVVGLSLGGMTGQSLAARHPTRVASLTLMATAARMPPASAWMERAALVRREGTRAILDATMQRWFTAGFRASGAGVVRTTAEIFAALDADGYAACCEAIARMDLLP